MNTFKHIDDNFVANTYARFDLEIVKGKGAFLIDSDGKKYIDFNSGIAVNTFGIADKVWLKAVKSQLKKIQHASNLYYTKPCAILAKTLCEKTGAKKVFFSNSGAEANECAIKCARLWASNNKGKEYFNIITLKNSFHGRTITTLAANGQDVFHKDFTPLTEGFLYANANDIESVKQLVSENKVAGIMMEAVQGEGGVLPLEKEFVKGVKEICDKENILLIMDEVQTGNGRTGTLYAYQQYDITPDIVSTAKGLGGGLPLGATLFYDKTESVLTAGLHGSTFGGNPVATAGALSIVNRLSDEFLSEVKKKSEYIFNELVGAEGIKSVSGLGLMIGIETTGDATKIIKKCMEKGVLPIKAKNKVRLLPPLNIPWDLLKKGIAIIKQCAKEEK